METAVHVTDHGVSLGFATIKLERASLAGAANWLTIAEQNAAAMRHHPESLQDHLAGRVAAKTAVNRALRLPLSGYHRFEIFNNPIGVPELHGGILPHSLLVSIAHSGGEAAAVALQAPDLRGVGIDFELEREISAAATHHFAIPEEIALFSRFRNPALALWCVKEAATKAFPSPVPDPFRFAFGRIEPRTGAHLVEVLEGGPGVVMLKVGPPRTWAICVALTSEDNAMIERLWACLKVCDWRRDSVNI